MTGMYEVKYFGADGSEWHLDGSGCGRQGVFLVKVDGLVGSAEVATSPGPGRVGVKSTGLPTMPAFEGALEVAITGEVEHEPVDLPGTVARWRRAWSGSTDGTLMVQADGEPAWFTSARLSEPMPSPSESPYRRGLSLQTMTVDVECRDGVWVSQEHRIPTTSGAGVELWNFGELPMWPVVEWSGTRTVVAPGVDPVALPSTAMVARVNTDPASGTVITVDGEPDPNLWSQLRGRSFPVPVPAGGMSTWTVNGGAAALLTRARALDPWRW